MQGKYMSTSKIFYLCRIDFTNHDPWHNQIAKCRGNCENKDARHRNPCCCWFHTFCHPAFPYVHVGTKSNHCQSTANSCKTKVKKKVIRSLHASVGFDVLKMVTMKSIVSWFITPCSLERATLYYNPEDHTLLLVFVFIDQVQNADI